MKPRAARYSPYCKYYESRPVHLNGLLCESCAQRAACAVVPWKPNAALVRSLMGIAGYVHRVEHSFRQYTWREVGVQKTVGGR